MKNISSLIAAFTCALLVPHVAADNISLRLELQDQKGKIHAKPIHAEIGQFGLSTGRPEHSQENLLKVLAKDSAGNTLHETTVRNLLTQQLEVFDPKTGIIQQSKQVKRTSSMLEVTLPFHAATASIEVQSLSPHNPLTRSTPEPIAQFSRKQLVALLQSKVQARSLAGTASATAATIVEVGAAKDNMDLVFVGDGYTASEMNKWHSDAQKIINGFLADPLLTKYKGKINVRRVDVASRQSGVDEPDKGIFNDTAMDGAFNCADIARLLCVNTDKVFNIVGSVLAPDARDHIIVISNSTRYGGSGGEVAAMSMNGSSIEVALHEIGHTVFALADEYENGTCDTSREPAAGNATLNASRRVKWNSFIQVGTSIPTRAGQYPNGTVGIFEGGHYCTKGIYRPTENSRMRTLGYPWHAVNEDLASKVFAKYLGTPSGDGITQTGSLTQGAVMKAPSAAPNYINAGSGTFKLSLSGPSGTNFDLALFKWNNTSWAKVATSNGNAPMKSISYSGTAGYYYAEIKSVTGSGNYTLKYSFPAK